MKKHTPFRIGLAEVGITIVAILTLGASGTMLAKSPIPQKAGITLTIVNNNLVIEGSSGQRGNCPPPVEKGCIRVSTYKKAHITFKLVNSEGWAFSRMQLVAEPKPVAEPTAKLNFGAQNDFEQRMIDDFYVQTNKNTRVHPDTDGIIVLNGLNNGDKFKLIDLNEFTQVYTYQIEACKNGTNCKMTDPKIVNEG